jgi:hypothetical protein
MMKQKSVLFVSLLFASCAFSADGQFRNQVQPILARFGCSSGACHGAAAGKNGFRLSLRGYDDEGDYNAIVRHAGGRRVNPADPGRSLLLLKATHTLSHKGGKRFDVGSREYNVLADWIANGMPAPADGDPRITRIEVLPDQVNLKPGDTHQVQVKAHFSNGAVEDVTPWAKYTDSDSAVTVTDEHGRLAVRGSGEGAITAWYLSKIATATVTVPYPGQVSAEVFANAPRRNLIDELVLAKLKSLNLPPSPPCDDATFIRRAFLDTIGVLPTADEARAFLADKANDKRDKLINSLLTRAEFVDYWTYKWSDLLLVNSSRLPKETMWAYHGWIRNHVAANTPWDQFVRQIVTATGPVFDNGAGSFYLLHDDPTEMAENVSLAFLGMSINCAKCHNHPLEKWTNEQYFAFANLFARVRVKESGKGGNKIVFTTDAGELIRPLTGTAMMPTPLDGSPLAFDQPGDRRERMADWLVSRDNPYFARAIVNRVWANYMGVGLVESIDDMRQTNPASNEPLLTALAKYLADQKYDLKALMRLILQSQAYQRSSEPLPAPAGNAGDRRFYSRYYPRRLMAEVMLDALSQVTGSPTTFKDYPAGWRAIQLPDANVESYFLTSFGRPERVLTCECERTSDPSMAQVLHLANGDTINQKLKARGNRLDALLKANTTDEQLVMEVYLSALARFPSDAETKALVDTIAASKDVPRRELLEDLYWSVLSSKEFLFNH